MRQKSLIYIQLFIFTFLVVYVAVNELMSHNEPTTQTIKVMSNYDLPSIEIPDQVSFAGEWVPLNDPDVRERLDRELHVNTFWHSNTIFLLKRGNRWLPKIAEVLRENDIPEDFKYLPLIESDLQNKVSPRQAVGFWQLLSGTAKDYGLEVNSQVDERYDPIKSTKAACGYLNQAYTKFQSWSNAAASYNIGMRGLTNRLEKQRVESYYDLLLNEETSRYVFRIIAIKMIFENPRKYGFDLSQDQLYHTEELKKIKVDRSIDNLRDFAFEQGINYKILKRYNPWLRKNELTVRRGKEYYIAIPK
ncbi:MAG TPA: murein transglycosylase [Cytophagales bacterium]|jgi:membrane-bound lytic murein transglycosylase D|nr:murein transglycosylase [Cytophagales bacterium]